jgi:teichoic acid transport system permease protein
VARTETPVGTASGDVPPEQRYPGLKQVGVRPTIPDYIREAWDRREFATTIAVGELKAQNQNTVLGSIWHLLNPLFLAGVYYFVFGVVLGARRGAENYAGFLIVGIFVFFFTQKVVLAGTRVVTSNEKLVQNINFPRILLPTATTIQESLAQMPALFAMAVITFVTQWVTFNEDYATFFSLQTGLGPEQGGPLITPMWLLIIPVLLMQSFFNLGGSLVAARLTFHFRDTEFILPYLMRIWFYLSGVFFGVEFVIDNAGGILWGTAPLIFQVNPAYVFIHLTREAVMNNTTDPIFWYLGLGWSFGLFFLGFFFFRAREEEYSRV